MQFDLEAEWQLLQTCNFRCDYCFYSVEELGEKLRPAATPAAWSQAFEATGLTWLLHITGGEPSVYPGFVTLVRLLTERHYVAFNTNLTHPCLETFAREIDPSRIYLINAGFHPDERRAQRGDAAYLRNGRALREAGFPILATLVATPEALADYGSSVERLAEAGLYPWPKLLRGEHRGRIYPNAYSARERDLFRHHAEVARDFYAPVLQRISPPPGEFMIDGERFLHGEPTFRGSPCTAGRDFVSIDSRGAVFRCDRFTVKRSPQGDLLAGTFKRTDGPAPCDTQFCFGFCRKFSTALPAYHPRSVLRRLRRGAWHDLARLGASVVGR